MVWCNLDLVSRGKGVRHGVQRGRDTQTHTDNERDRDREREMVHSGIGYSYICTTQTAISIIGRLKKIDEVRRIAIQYTVTRVCTTA